MDGQGDCMITIRQNSVCGFAAAGWILLLCIAYASYAVSAVSGPAKTATEARPARAQSAKVSVSDLKFTHLTTNDGLSQSNVTAILQDGRGFMWIATRDGLNRYDGNAFVVYKHNPNDPESLSSNFIEDLVEDDHGYLWISTNSGVNRFNPITERFTRYLHDPHDPNSIGGIYITRIARDSR